MTQRQKKKPLTAPGLPIKVHVRCGCGNGYYLKRLDAEVVCGNCRWPILWASGSKDGLVNEWSLSRHIAMTITREEDRT